VRTAEFIERCIAAGMSVEDALKAGSAFEAETASPRNVSVYVIAGGGLVKVGVSDNPGYRVYALQAGSPVALTLEHMSAQWDRATAMKVERTVHEMLKDRRRHGEWFACSLEEAVSCIVSSEELVCS
jgi:hypothetical protein